MLGRGNCLQCWRWQVISRFRWHHSERGALRRRFVVLALAFLMRLSYWSRVEAVAPQVLPESPTCMPFLAQFRATQLPERPGCRP